ncbi:MAG: DUF934 domain-containing protein [Alphaproteobacteria bacterium]|nr:DUF934 domain-containing protein [Alphaproteobacteria bacterium]
MPVVTDTGFVTDPTALVSLSALESGGGEPGHGVEVANTIDARDLAPHFEAVDLIAVAFPSFADGRGFSLARRLRALGYRGRLRAKGHVIADQYPLARACGFDEVEIDETLAQRQPEEHWLAVAAVRGHALQARR